jgi:hypothetical protein
MVDAPVLQRAERIVQHVDQSLTGRPATALSGCPTASAALNTAGPEEQRRRADVRKP